MRKIFEVCMEGGRMLVYTIKMLENTNTDTPAHSKREKKKTISDSYLSARVIELH